MPMITDVILDYLQTRGIGTVGTDLFNGFLPAAPNKAAAVFLYGGSTTDTKRGYTEPRLNFRVRDTIETTAYDFAWDIYNQLHGLHNITLQGISIISCKGIQSEPQTTGRDEQERSTFSVNFELRIRKATRYSV